MDDNIVILLLYVWALLRFIDPTSRSPEAGLASGAHKTILSQTPGTPGSGGRMRVISLAGVAVILGL